MASVFRPTTIEDEGALIDFLSRAFSVGPETPFLNPALLRWKFWEPREDWAGPRGFVIEREGRIAAHVGLWPVSVQVGDTCERGAHMMDWASDPKAPGAGASLVQRLTKTHDFIYAMGGSSATRSLLPRLGFRPVEDALTWARALRPWPHARLHQNRNWTLPLRLLRNIWWAQNPRRSPPSGWTVAATSPGGSGFTGERPAGFFRYLDRCPALRLLTFDILCDGRAEGSFALAAAQRQARIVGIWLKNPSADHFRIAQNLAQGAAINHTDCCEIVARGLEKMSRGAADAGMRVRDRSPVFLYRKSGDFDSLPLGFQIGDNDRVFFCEERLNFLS
jgi:hypothetical protein